ncbi:prepilin-type N-terminal cleavage/methylation domain-containing protein [Acidovorax sp. HDW3]|uniref:GspH/FimT family pseudopilin n=1 Tax=Acidovorax sp. HDW3 TaxID=2714923 RepID=UPI00140912ED|nr:GspH/FimT family pseudopilin [Acidovorax sp. HDW3]QIL43006.1 prepilin-type N-terminal cleavage/methylation domain-containing protein [Acidovorax sp. HDW3]
MRRVQGFTLIELLVVFVIMALLVSVVPAAFDRMREAVQYRDTLRTIQADMRKARREALMTGKETRFTVDMRQRVYGLQGEQRHEVPSSLELRAIVAGVESSPSGIASIRFLPRGGATGGSIDVLRASGSGVRLRVDWLSGLVAQEALTP